MKDWIPQIIIGLIVTVVGTVLANAIVGGQSRGKHWSPRSFYNSPFRPGRRGEVRDHGTHLAAASTACMPPVQDRRNA
jgi:hypothetical protein